MDYTISVGSLLTAILILVAIIAIIFIIVLLARIARSLSTLPSTMQHLDNVMADVEAIVDVAKSGAEGARNVVEKASAALTGVNEVMDSNKGTLKAATSFVNACTSLASLIKKK